MEKASSPTPVTVFGGKPAVFSADTSASYPYLPCLGVTEIWSMSVPAPSYSQSKITPCVLLDFVVVNVVPVICVACAAVSAVHTLKFLTAPDPPELPAAAALVAPAPAGAALD